MVQARVDSCAGGWSILQRIAENCKVMNINVLQAHKINCLVHFTPPPPQALHLCLFTTYILCANEAAVD